MCRYSDSRCPGASERSQFDVPLDLSGGTAFQQSVWKALLEIPPGTTTSYGALGRQLGRPLAVRAVGAAVGRNPLSVVVPCHRVLGADGSLTGYAGGIDRKRALLTLEHAPLAAPRFRVVAQAIMHLVQPDHHLLFRRQAFHIDGAKAP